MITRRFKRLTIALLLPLLVLRGMLPAGYMTVADEAGLRVVMCSAGLAALHADAAGTPHDLPPNAGECTFALSANGAPPAEFRLLQAATVWTATAGPDHSGTPLFSERPRAHPVRGPPSLS